MPDITRELDHITNDLLRQRNQISEHMADQTQTHNETSDLLKKIEELRERMERTSGLVPPILPRS